MEHLVSLAQDLVGQGTQNCLARTNVGAASSKNKIANSANFFRKIIKHTGLVKAFSVVLYY